MASSFARSYALPRRVGTFFAAPGEAVATLAPSPSGELPVGVAQGGRGITSAWTAPGQASVVLGDGWAVPLLVLRALAGGVRVTVATGTPRVWQRLGTILGDSRLLEVLDADDLGRLERAQPELLVIDMPHERRWLPETWDERSALVLCLQKPHESDLSLLRRADLLLVCASALPARPGSLIASVIGQDWAGRSLSEGMAVLRRDGAVREIRWAPTRAEHDVLGL